MLPEDEIRQRAQYCYLVFMQLSRLRSNEAAAPDRYIDYLKRSTLKLAEDEFILSIIEEELRMGSSDAGLGYLIALYEGFAHAFGEVLKVPLEDIREAIPADFREKLASEMDGKIIKRRRKRIDS
jgi:hypothetical protein